MMKKIILLFSIIICLIFAFKKIEKKDTEYQRTIQLDYEGISSGKNFDGTPFDKNQIIDREIAKKLYSDFELNKDFKNIDELLKNISLEGVVPDNIKNTAQKELRKGDKFEYYPTQYKVKFNYSGVKGEEFLEKLLSESAAEYKKRYLLNENVEKIVITEKNRKEYDYVDYLEVFKIKLDQINEKINFFKEKNFYGSKNNGALNKLETEIGKIKTVEISNYRAYIQINNITLDKEMLTLDYENRIREAELEKRTLQEEAQGMQQVIKNYAPSEKQIILGGAEGNVKLNNIDDYYSELIKTYRDTVVKITELDRKIREDKMFIEKLRVPTEKEETYLRDKLEDILAKTNTQVDETNILLEEYYKGKYSKFIEIVPRNNQQ